MLWNLIKEQLILQNKVIHHLIHLKRDCLRSSKGYLVQKVILHHPFGRFGVNLYNVVGVTQQQHLAIHAIIGYRNANWLGVLYNLGSGVF